MAQNTSARRADSGNDIAGQVASAVLLPVAVARQVLPQNSLPVYLGIGALAVAGAVEWPVAAAAGVGYAALRRWGPLKPESKS
jgi:hypothetical protein